MDIGRGPASRDAHQGIHWSEIAFLKIRLAGFEPVLKALGTAQQRWAASSQDPLNQLRRAAKGWRALGCIQHTEAPRGAGPQIKETPSGLKALSDGLNRLS